MTRRGFLRTMLASLAGIVAGGFHPLWAGKLEHSKRNFWKNGMFTQKNVDLSQYGRGVIRARVDGSWQNAPLREASANFRKWNLERRQEFISQVKTGVMPSLGGPHSGMVATYGLRRHDSQFSLNNAVKGMGLAPRDEYLEQAIARLQETTDRPMPEKMEVLAAMYRDPEFFDWRKQTSLELYSTPDFETHTFLNIMENPVATIVFLDIPSYELRTIARVVHPDDTAALPSERMLLEYVNLAHEYMHGEFSRKFPLLVFYLVEEFDNTPGAPRGVRTVPPQPE